MKNSKGFVYFLIFSLIAGLVSCDTGSNDNNNIALFVVASQKIQEAQKASALKKSMVKMSGKISMPEGAVPSEFIEAANAAGKNSTRGTGIDVSNLTGYTYFIETKNSAGETFNPDYDFDNTDGTFTITLLPGTWKLKAGINNDEGTTVYISDEITQTVTAEDSVFNKTFVLHPLQKSDGEGHFKINMTVSENVKKVVMKFVSGDSGKWGAAGLDTEVPLTVSGTTVRLPDTTVTMASGSYTVRFLFYDSTAEYPTLLFSSYQTINIYDGLTSDKWNASASIGDADSVIDSSGNFVVTNSLVNSYMISNIYVASAANGGNDDNAGSYYGPVATLNKAFRSIASYGNASGEYTINIKGELSGNFEVPASINSKAQKITICGANEPVNGVPVDTLTVDTTGTVLKVVSTVPVEIKNLKITGGNGADCGGGIYAQGSGVEVTLGDGALVIENYAKQLGGGVYLTDSAKLIINTGAKITKNNVTDENVNGNHGGMALCAVSATVTMNGGEISENKGTETNHRGPIRLKNSSIFDLNEGLVSGNSAIHMGGCFYLEDNSKLNMIGGEISGCQIGNDSSYDALGGAVLTTGISQFNMSGGKICGNKAKNTHNSVGAGVCVWSAGSSFNLSGGSIEGNTVENGNKWGGAVAVYPNAIFNISGGARIPYDGEIGKNDVYLIRNSENEQGAVTIKGELTSSDNIVATITPQNWVRNSIALKAESAIITNEVASRFKISDGDFNINKNTSNTRGLLAAPIYVAGQGTKGTDYFVCSRGGSTSSDAAGTKANPYATLTQALGAIDGGGNEVIYIDGKIVGKSEIPDGFTTSKCSRLTLKGASYLNPNEDGSPKDALDGNYANRTLVISSAVPVVIENLKITRGWSKDLASSGTKGGGGIRLNENACLELSDGAMVTENYARLWGGGIFVQTGASLYMNGSSYVGDYIEETASHTYVGHNDAPSEPDSCCSNKAGYYGGGIYSHGSVYLGYKNEGGSAVESDWTGGVCRNSSDYGGGLYLNEGSLKISSGNIAYNYCTYNGGAIGTNEENETNVELLGGEIKENVADLNGGAIYVAKELSVQGNVSIPFGVAGVTGAGKNDIYLKEGKTITVSGTLTPPSGVTTVATITPSAWKRGTEYLSASSSNATALSDAIGKFKLSQDDSGWDRADNISTSETAKKVWITSPIYVVGASGTGSTKPTGFEYGKTTGANGTKTSPYASIADALTATDLANATEPNTIIVAGTLVGAQQEVSSPSVDITIKGYKAAGATKSDAKIQRWASKKTTSQDAGSVLIVNASGKTVTITDLTLSYGASSNGGGIYITNGTVKLGDYAKISENYAGNKGGGVYVSSGATLFMYGKALIGDKLSTDTGITTATGQNYGNAAPYQGGGGIYNEGSVYIGYNGFKADGTTLQESVIDAGYGIIRCFTMNQDGGAIYNNGTLKIKSGSISYNRTVNSGGAVVCVADATISGGTFESNYAGVSGGAVSIKASKTLTINGDAIFKNNQAESGGGAISNLGTLTMTAGTIGESGALNRIAEGKTGSGGAISQKGTFNISGSAQVYSGTGVGEKQNDVYLASGKTVTAGVFETGGNSSSIPMVITPYSWTRGSTAVTAATGVTLDATKLKCFKMSDEDWSVVLHSSAGKIDAPVYVASDTSSDGFNVCTGLGSDTDGIGSRAKPYATIAKALSKAWDTSTTKTIPLVIKIDGEVKGAQTISGTINAQRVIVSGASNSHDTKPSVLNGGFDSESPGTTLTVTTSTPVFLNRITIKGGYNASGNGGGLSISGSASIVDMQCAWIEGNYAISGGGVYVASGCSFYFEDYGCIGSSDDNLTVNQIDATTGLTRGVNKAYNYGAGVYNQGTFYMGYTYNISTGNAEDVSWDGDLNPLVTKNYCYNNGGGVCTVGSMKMSAGKVSINKAPNGSGIYVKTSEGNSMTLCGGTISSNRGDSGKGGGMYVDNGASVIVESGVYDEGNIISGNTAKSGGGVYVAANGSFEIKNNSPMYIYGNISSDGSTLGGGGGVYVANNGIFEMRYGWIGRDENGTINPNFKTRDGKGSGVYIGGTGSQFNMSYGAHVDGTNDVYVPSGAFIGVRWNETGFPADPPPAIITPATYSPSWVIVKDVDENQFTWSISNFKVTPNGTQNYKIQAGGPNTGYFVTDN